MLSFAQFNEDVRFVSYILMATAKEWENKKHGTIKRMLLIKRWLIFFL